MRAALHVHHQQIERGLAVADGAVADQNLGGDTIGAGAIGEACANQAAKAASVDGIPNAVGLGNHLECSNDVLVWFYPDDQAVAGGGARSGGLKQGEVGLGVGQLVDADAAEAPAGHFCRPGDDRFMWENMPVMPVAIALGPDGMAVDKRARRRTSQWWHWPARSCTGPDGACVALK